MKKIEALLNERKNYPVGAKTQNKNQIDYILHRIDDDANKSYLILPSFFLQRGIGEVKEVKDLIFEAYNLSAIIGLGKIWEPYTSIQFNLIVLSKEKKSEIFICEEPEGKTFTVNGKISKSGLIENQVITKKYKDYLEKIDQYLEKGNENGLNGFKIKQTDFDKEKFYLEYYLPRYREIDEKLAKEKTLPLSDLVEVIVPRTSKEEGKVLRVGNFSYPLEIEKLPVGRRGKNELQKSDILISRVGNSKSYLIAQKLEEVYPTVHTYILRVTSEKISSEYLYLFLQSEVAKKYVLRNSTGSVLSHINKKDLERLPIIIPQKETLVKSKQVFETLYLKPKENKAIDEINDLLFSPKKVKKPIQEEFVDELLEKIKSTKLTLIKEIVEADFKEIKKCVNQEAYKATVILCGSILEAVLLDWLSEIKRRNFINAREELSFFDMIKEMERTGVFDRKLTDYAHKVRDYRNLVHPKKMLKKEIELSSEIVKDMIWKLKKILEKRELT